MSVLDTINHWFEGMSARMSANKSRRAASGLRAAVHKSILKLIGIGSDPKAAGLALNLYELWGDPLDPSRESYLRSCLTEMAATRGHVLLSSASLMTIVLGAISSGDKERTIWCLEQDPHWTHMIRSWLAQYAIKRTYVVAAPSTVRGGMVRYRIETKHLPKNLGLILCDGDGAAPGSALATLLSIGSHLAPEFTVLARRVRGDEDLPLLKRWAAKNNATIIIVNGRDGFVKISRRKAHAMKGRVSYEVEDIKAAAVG